MHGVNQDYNNRYCAGEREITGSLTSFELACVGTWHSAVAGGGVDEPLLTLRAES